MNKDLLKTMASKVTAFDGAVTFYMLPFTTPRAASVLNDMMTIQPDMKKWRQNYDVVMVIEGHTVDIEFHNVENGHIKSLHVYWQNRQHSDTAANLEAARWVSGEMANALVEISNEVKEANELPLASASLRNGAPSDSDENFPSTGQP